MRFQLPTKIVFGSGVIAQIKEIIDELQVEKLFLVTDTGIKKAGIADRVLNYLPDIEVFDKIEPNPKHITVDKAGMIVRKHKPELIIGLGGGSVLDAAKAIALLATNPGDIEDYEGKGKYQVPPLPVLAIPTTCGTGSEVTWVSVITQTQRQFKMSIKGPHMFPAVALVDPDLLETLPPALIASTGMDALVHAIEAYTVKPATFITDFLAQEAIQQIFHSLESAFQDIQGNRSARENLMRGSLLAGMAFCNSDVGGVHCISESVGALFDTPHGVANAIFLPHVMEFNLPVSTRRYAEIAKMAGIEEKDEKRAAVSLIRKIRGLSHTLHIPSFKEIGIREDHFPGSAQRSFQNNSNPSNPRDASVEDYLEILKRAFSDD
jgi:alcohol dehydrogenase